MGNNIENARRVKDSCGEMFCFDAMKQKSCAAAGLCVFVINIIMYFDIVSQMSAEVRQGISDALASPELADVKAKIKSLEESLRYKRDAVRSLGREMKQKAK